MCSSYIDDGLYFIKPLSYSLFQIKMFKVTEPTPKKKKDFYKDNTCIWCLRGHINIEMIKRLTKNGSLRELTVGTLPICESCLEGKMTKRPFSAKGERGKEPPQLIHTEYLDI